MKKTFRKLGLATALVLAMVGFAACGDDDDDDDDKGGNSNSGKVEVIDAGSIEGVYHMYKVVEDGETITGIEDENIKVIKKSSNEFLLCRTHNDGTYYEDDPEDNPDGILKFDDELLTNQEYAILEVKENITYIKITGKDAFEIRGQYHDGGDDYYEYYKKISK